MMKNEEKSQGPTSLRIAGPPKIVARTVYEKY